MQENMTNSQGWNDCLKYMSRRMKEQSYNTWLKPTIGQPGDNGNYSLSVPNQFVADWIKSHYYELIDEAFVEVLGQKYKIEFIINESQIESQPTLELYKAPDPVRANNHRHNLNEKYNFDSLVVGDFNQFACAAAMAIAEAPGMTKYNPLLTYGGTGLGKTHIAQAIGNQIVKLFPDKRVMYATSEKFTSDFIASISDRSIADFTRSYRDVDVLIIDDIQFFSGKESTQEQFFHTFNALYQSGKQIVLTSDRSPREIKGLEERLLSRFSSGLVTDLQAPDLEARTAILYKKLESEGLNIDEAVIKYIASQVSTNIRELEGSLIRVLAYASLKSVPVNLDTAAKVLSDSVVRLKKEVTIENIQKNSAEHFNIELKMMGAKKKTSEIVLARQVAMYLCRSLTDNSLKLIGESFGGRDHSTVIHACNLVANKMLHEPLFREKIDRLSASLLY